MLEKSQDPCHRNTFAAPILLFWKSPRQSHRPWGPGSSFSIDSKTQQDQNEKHGLCAFPRAKVPYLSWEGKQPLDDRKWFESLGISTFHPRIRGKSFCRGFLALGVSDRPLWAINLFMEEVDYSSQKMGLETDVDGLYCCPCSRCSSQSYDKRFLSLLRQSRHGQSIASKR